MATTHYFWDRLENNVAGEFDDNGNIVASYVTKPNLYGDVMSQRRADSGARHYHKDTLGTVTELTDQGGIVTDTFRATAFGETAESTGSTTSPFKYVGSKGYYADSGLDSLTVRRRRYSPNAARWLSVDPRSFGHGRRSGANSIGPDYKYVLNNPFRYTDASGLKHEPLESDGCTEEQLKEIDAKLLEACDYVAGAASRCLPPKLQECMKAVCAGVIMTKCIAQCDSEKGHVPGCAYAQVTMNKMEFSDPTVGKPCTSSVPKGMTPVIFLCYKVKGSDKGLSDLAGCAGKPENIMQVMFHELMHFCGTKHKLDDRGQPIVEGDLTFGCMNKCFLTPVGDMADCVCKEC